MQVCVKYLKNPGFTDISCPSASDIYQSLRDTWSNPILSAHLIKDHDHTVSVLHSLSQSPEKPARKSHLPDPDTLPIEVTNLQKTLDAVSLKSFRWFRGTDSGE